MKNIAKTLDDIIRVGLQNTPLPYKKGNSIRIGPIAIRQSPRLGYILFDCAIRKQVTVTHSKLAALAWAKHYKNTRYQKRILELDNQIERLSNDCVFYQNTINNSNDQIKKFVAEDRLGVVKAQLQEKEDILEDIIFDV
jgi:hypothetical protein